MEVIQNGYNSASALKSTTGWTVFNGTNHSGLNIKPGGLIDGGYYSYTTANDPFLNDTHNFGQDNNKNFGAQHKMDITHAYSITSL